MPDSSKRFYAIQAARRRVVFTAQHAGQARERAAQMLELREEERDQIVVGEAGDEEMAELRTPPV
jgi:CMP-2-keto-3-deoxyoctulosonic acid synthetase